MSHGQLRVAVVKADARLRDTVLVPGLRDAGFDAVGLGDAAQLYRAMVSTTFDAVVLAADLPSEDGFSAAQYLRSVSALDIVMLGDDGAEPHVRSLQAGADVHLARPVEPALLAAVLNSLRRRGHAGGGIAPADVAREQEDSTWSLAADDWCLLAPDGTDVELTAQERALLRSLFAANQKTVTRETLIGLLSDHPEDFDPHRLDMLIHRLRRKVSKQTGLRLPLRAVRGQGYVLLPMAPGRPPAQAG